MVSIREYHEQDAGHVEDCIIELQSFEKTLEPNRADGSSIAAAYRQLLLAQCHQFRGRIFVAEVDGQVAGFACVLAHVNSHELIEENTDHAYLTDVVVLSAFRGRGIGRALVHTAENYARQQGASTLVVDLLAKNVLAREVYATLGYQEQEIRLRKALE